MLRASDSFVVKTKPVGHPAHRFLVFRLLLAFTSHLSLLTSHQATAQGVGPDSSYFLVHDFADDWQVYDEGAKAYVPYLPERHQNYSSFSLFLNLETARYYRLLVFSERESYLFLNASLQRQIPANTWAVLNVDSLYQRYRTPEILLTLYGREESPRAGPARATVLLGYRRAANQKPAALSGGLLLAKPRSTDDAFTNFFILGFLVILLGYAGLFVAFNKAFSRFYSVRDLLTINPRDPTLSVTKSLDISNLFFVFHLSLVVAYLYLIVANQNVDLFSTQSLLREGQTLGDLLIRFGEAALLAFALFIGKYALLQVLGSLYRFERVADYHYFKILQASSQFFTGLLLVVMVMASSFPAALVEVETYVVVPVVLFFLARLVLLYFSINKLASVKNLYLFSYLCIVELIPIIVGIRFAL